jgi:putative ABC transport system permease protein
MTAAVDVGVRAAGTAPGRSRIISIALREIVRSGGSFKLLIACIALGVAVIAGVGSLSDAIRTGFEQQGQVLLGGDVTLARPHREATAEERRWMDARGRVSETATMRSMARRTDGQEQALVEVKGVDGAYPLVGELKVSGDARPVPTQLADRGAIVDPILLERLGLKPGDQMQLGRIEVRIAGLLGNEPDKIADRFTVGPRVFISLATLQETGLAEPGGLVRWRYAMLLPDGRDPEALKTLREVVKVELAEGGFAVNDRTNPSPAISRTLDQLRQFLTLVGLASLLIGGVGVANAVKAYIDRRRKVIAVMKSLGASSRQIFILHIAQVGLLAGIGILLGLLIGIAIPLFADRAIAGALPVDIRFGVSWSTVALAVAYGVLVSFAFTLWPIGQAAEIRAAAIFREHVAPQSKRPKRWVIVTTAMLVLCLAALAITTSSSRVVASYFMVGVAGIFVIFPLLGSGLAWVARRVRRPRRPELALALGSIGGPGGLTRSVVLSLGAGLSLLSAVALVDASIVNELQTRLPKNSPNYFLIDIPQGEIDALQKTVLRSSPEARIAEAPMLRGRLVALAGTPVEQIKAPPEAQWVLRGDRGLSYSANVPDGSSVVEGRWWPADYEGEPLVSFEADLARLLKVGIGDQVTVNVLGRNVTARIANLREVRWESLGINFVLVFSPNVLKAAPHNVLATVTLPPSVSIAEEAALAKVVGNAHPAVTVIRVKDAIEAFNSVFRKVMTAIRAAGSVTLLAGALVLAGALATAQRERIRLAVILKTLGATRRQIVLSHVAEYVILASATAAVSAVVGAIGAWATLTFLMRVPFLMSWPALGQVMALSIGLVMLIGLAGTWRVLAVRAVPQLRSD